MEHNLSDWEKYSLPSIQSLKAKRVLVRVDFNMPVSNGEILDTSRFDVTVPFFKEL